MTGIPKGGLALSTRISNIAAEIRQAQAEDDDEAFDRAVDKLDEIALSLTDDEEDA